MGFRQNRTSSIRSCTQNSGPTYLISLGSSLETIADVAIVLTLVTNRLKLLETSGKLKASLCVLNSLTLPSPALFTLAGSLGRFGGSSEDSSKSETLVERAEVGTLNFLGAGCWVLEAAGGNDGRAETGGRGLVGGCRSLGSVMTCPEGGTGM